MGFSNRLGCTIFAMLLVGAANALAQSDLRFDVVSVTPYDAQLHRVHRYLNTKAATRSSKLSLTQVNEWMDQLRDVPYEFSASWKTPDELRSSAKGDCKAKSISLFYLMKASGAKNLLLVIGREKYSRPESHAWLIWQVGGNHYLLDPTHNSKAVQMQAFDPDRYIPHFAYSAKKKFRPGIVAPASLSMAAPRTYEHSPGIPLLASRD